MIPLSTPIGAKIVCTDATRPRCGWEPLPALIEGETYILNGFTPGAGGKTNVMLRGTTHPQGFVNRVAYLRHRFRLPVTPEGLLSVPSEAPADLDRRTAPVSPRKRVRA